MKKIFLTPELTEIGLIANQKGEMLNPQDTQEVVKQFKTAQKKAMRIEVWGITTDPNTNPGKIITIIDHINCTGNNPLKKD